MEVSSLEVNVIVLILYEICYSDKLNLLSSGCLILMWVNALALYRNVVEQYFFPLLMHQVTNLLIWPIKLLLF